ncbi:putative Late nodulin [Medicago truncatula]|uniref:Putative Late nodulin n=1 Tax=Medicago truncatula TaxID=3880 RepID=A0A396GSC4_MEDTR|nr:putative Late nodulin [Medicago truncatula]
MTTFFKSVYTMIILLLLFLFVTNATANCTSTVNCVHTPCMSPTLPLCVQDECVCV